MRRRIIVTALIMLCLILLQGSVIPRIPLLYLKPNLFLIFVVSIAFMRGRNSGIIIGLVSGLLLDFMSGSVIGFQAMILMIIGYFAGFLCKVFFDEDLKVPVILTAAADFIFGSACFCFYKIPAGQLNYLRYLRLVIIPEMISTVLFTILLYKLFFWINQRLSAYELEEQQSPWLRK